MFCEGTNCIIQVGHSVDANTGCSMISFELAMWGPISLPVCLIVRKSVWNHAFLWVTISLSLTRSIGLNANIFFTKLVASLVSRVEYGSGKMTRIQVSETLSR